MPILGHSQSCVASVKSIVDTSEDATDPQGGEFMRSRPYSSA